MNRTNENSSNSFATRPFGLASDFPSPFLSSIGSSDPAPSVLPFSQSGPHQVLSSQAFPNIQNIVAPALFSGPNHSSNAGQNSNRNFPFQVSLPTLPPLPPTLSQYSEIAQRVLAHLPTKVPSRLDSAGPAFNTQSFSWDETPSPLAPVPITQNLSPPKAVVSSSSSSAGPVEASLIDLTDPLSEYVNVLETIGLNPNDHTKDDVIHAFLRFLNSLVGACAGKNRANGVEFLIGSAVALTREALEKYSLLNEEISETIQKQVNNPELRPQIKEAKLEDLFDKFGYRRGSNSKRQQVPSSSSSSCLPAPKRRKEETSSVFSYETCQKKLNKIRSNISKIPEIELSNLSKEELKKSVYKRSKFLKYEKEKLNTLFKEIINISEKGKNLFLKSELVSLLEELGEIHNSITEKLKQKNKAKFFFEVLEENKSEIVNLIGSECYKNILKKFI